MVRGRTCAQPRHKAAGALSAHSGEDRGGAGRPWLACPACRVQLTRTWPSRPTLAAAWSSWITGKGRASGSSFGSARCPLRPHSHQLPGPASGHRCVPCVHTIYTPPIPNRSPLAPHTRGFHRCSSALVVAGFCAVAGTRAVLRPSSALRAMRAAPPAEQVQRVRERQSGDAAVRPGRHL